MADQKKILIVDDERPLAHALELKLGHEGFLVKAAFDGEEALTLLQTEQFDLVLLDLVMPKVDGFSVLTKLKEQNNPTKVIVSSNLSQEEDAMKAKSLGAVDYYIKSNTTLSEIVERIKKQLV